MLVPLPELLKNEANFTETWLKHFWFLASFRFISLHNLSKMQFCNNLIFISLHKFADFQQVMDDSLREYHKNPCKPCRGFSFFTQKSRRMQLDVRVRFVGTSVHDELEATTVLVITGKPRLPLAGDVETHLVREVKISPHGQPLHP